MRNLTLKDIEWIILSMKSFRQKNKASCLDHSNANNR